MSDESLVPSSSTPALCPADDLHALSLLEATAERLIEALPTLDDAQLEAVAQSAESLGKTSWRLTCAICAEVACRDFARGQKEAYVAGMANRMGMQPGTLLRNAQIHKELLSGPELGLGTQTLTEKTFFEEALRAPDPPAALEMMETKKAVLGAGYTTTDARADVTELRGGANIVEQETVFWVRVGLYPAQRTVLEAFARKWKVSNAEALARCLAMQAVIEDAE